MIKDIKGNPCQGPLPDRKKFRLIKQSSPIKVDQGENLMSAVPVYLVQLVVKMTLELPSAQSLTPSGGKGIVQTHTFSRPGMSPIDR